MENFKSLELPKIIETNLKKLKLEKPTEIQIKAIPEALSGKDLIISSPTGSGKTLAFCIPLLVKLINNPNIKGIIITPTREIAIQIEKILLSLTTNNNKLQPCLLIGGNPIDKQLNKLKNKPRLIVGTPGRINDHLKRRTLNLQNTEFLVLDEMDRMLDMGFSEQIDNINNAIKNEKQIMMLSATIPNKINIISKKYLNNPIKIEVASNQITNSSITQDFLHLKKSEKFSTLLEELKSRSGTKIIFVKTKRNSEDIAKKLKDENFKARAIHGDLRQRTREKLIREFREEKFAIIVATDVAARGIDIPHIKHVINYNIPTQPEDYVHRIGRTGRAGLKGDALTFISEDESKLWRDLDLFLHPEKKASKDKNPKKNNNNKKANSSKNNFNKKKKNPANKKSKFPFKKKQNKNKKNKSSKVNA